MNCRGPGLYVHVPFCGSVCPYCDFAVVLAGEARREGWVRGVVAEARMWAGLGLRFDTLYLGGGTPSCLRSEQLDEVLTGLRKVLRVDPDAAVTLEANPEDVTPERAVAWRELGVSHLSVGVQSFDDRTLARLGRRHDGRRGAGAVETALAAGFHWVSADLIFGLEGQSEGAWGRDLDRAAGLGVHHLSCYQLTVHEGTVFGRRRDRGELRELNEARQAGLYRVAHARPADHGYAAYEVSNFAAAPEHRSRHNLKYWSHVPYLGLGPSAHSFDGRRRWWNRRKLRLWQRDVDAGRPPVEGEEVLSRGQLALEMVLLGLRTAEGVDLMRLRRVTGVALAERNRRLIGQLEAEGLVELGSERLRPTRAGLAVADGLAGRLEVEG